MDIIEFPEQTVVYAKDQPEYRNLPAHVVGDREGTIICCWELSDEELETVIKTRKIWHSIYTFNQPLQPQLLTTYKPDMKNA